ncbi:hypothetical protein [Endozoicomonas sp. 4G]|uniref:hypothetical protein n=1 Tax=Endozoicomonas sp. 4G TaxID=2872754 RepID=UPI0020791CB8|nr:hypothetical protein [Endozoicomonas sp. 4G]
MSFSSFHSDSQADRESPSKGCVSGDALDVESGVESDVESEGEAVICQTGWWSMQAVCTDKRLFSNGWSRITG